MEKRYLICVLLLLSGCQKKRVYECYLKQNDIEIYLDIIAENNKIETIYENEIINLKEDAFLIENNKELLLEQLSDYTYEIIDNKIHIKSNKKLDEEYNLKESIESLRRDGFYCDKR